MGVPDVEVLVKYKFREDLKDAKVKVREISRHSGHPFRLANLKMVRCLSVPWKFAESRHVTMEVVSMERLKGFVHGARAMHQGDRVWGELDVEEVFPHILRVLWALEHQWDMLCEKRGAGLGDLFFHIHKAGIQSLDFVGPSSRDPLFHHLSFNDLLSFVVWDLACNDCLWVVISHFKRGHTT